MCGLFRSHAGLAGVAAIGRGHEARTLFVAGQDHPDRLRSRQAVEKVEIFLTGNAENIFDALFLETLDEQVGCFFHVTSPPLSPASAGAVPVVPAPGGTLRSGGSSLVRESLLQRRAVVTTGAGVGTGGASPPLLAVIHVRSREGGGGGK